MKDSASALKKEIARLQAWVHDLQSQNFVNCVYCGHRYGPNATTPVSLADVLKKHVERCKHHPMNALRKERDQLKRENKNLRAQLKNETLTNLGL